MSLRIRPEQWPPLARPCDAGSGDACDKLSHGYLYGWGVAKDIAHANQLHGRACELGVAWACYELAEQYSSGEGVPRDPARAASYARMACELDKQHCAPAAATASPARTARAPSPGQGTASSQTPRDADDSCSNNPDREVAASDCYVVGSLESSGLSGGPDWPKALWAYDRACTLGHRSGCTEAAKIRRTRGAISPRAPARAAAARPARSVPASSSQVRPTDFTVLGVKLGSDTLQTVQAVLRSSGATVADSPGDKLYDQRIKALSGNFSGINPRYSAIAFDFRNTDSAAALVDVIVIYPGGNLSMMHERAAALARAYGPSDMPPHIAYHKLVRGAEIILYYDARTSQLNEHYRVPRQGS